MTDITIYEGKKIAFKDLRKEILSFGKSHLLDELSKGYVPEWIPPVEGNPFYDSSPVRDYKAANLEYYGHSELIGILEKSGLGHEERLWLSHFEKLNKMLRSFDRRAYEAMNENEQHKHALRLGRKCANILSLMECNDAPMNYFLGANKTIYVRPPYKRR